MAAGFSIVHYRLKNKCYLCKKISEMPCDLAKGRASETTETAEKKRTSTGVRNYNTIVTMAISTSDLKVKLWIFTSCYLIGPNINNNSKSISSASKE